MGLLLLKSAACLAILMVFYKIVLEKQSYHQFKRFYLLFALLVSGIIPFITFIEYIEPVLDFGTFNPESINTPPYFPAETPVEINEGINYVLISLWFIYGLGVLFFATRFGINLSRLIVKIKQNEKRTNGSFIHVLLQKLEPPHTFFNYLFFNKTKIETQGIPNEVILHEETHAKQKHSLDILIVEILQVVFWFNPLIYLIKKDIKLNHEFLADASVLHNGISPKIYQNTLLEFSNPHQDFILANAINYSSFKKRFTVMKTKTSKKKLWLSSLLLLPILGILLYSFSSRELIEKPLEPIIDVAQNVNSSEEFKIGATDKNMREYRAFIKKYNETKIIYGGTYERAIIIYDKLMSAEQRASVEKYPPRLIPMPNLSKTTPRKLTNSIFEDFKNEDKYAIWIDGKHIANSILDNYSASDFVHYSGSKVAKNARSKKFPQPNQYHLYTKEGFKHTYKDSQLRRYEKAIKLYSDEIAKFLKGPRTDNSELWILYEKAYKIYSTFSQEELKTSNIKMPPPVPAKKTSHTARSISIKVLDNGTYDVNGIKANKASLVSTVNKFHQDISSEVRNKIINIHLTFADKETDEEVWFVYDALLDYGFHRLVTKKQEVVRSKGNTPFRSAKNDTSILLNGKNCDPCELTKEELINMKLTSSSGNEVNSFAVKFKGYPTQGNQGNKLNKKTRAIVSQYNGNSPAQILNIKLLGSKKNYSKLILIKQQKLVTEQEVKAYDAWAKKTKAEFKKRPKSETVLGRPYIINDETFRYYNDIYDRMSSQQKNGAESLPEAVLVTEWPMPTATNIRYLPKSNQQEPATKKEISEYNTWAKKMNASLNSARSNSKKAYPIVRENDVLKYKSIYSRMTYAQRENAVPWPNFPPPPPPPPAPENATPEVKAKYKKLNDEYERKYSEKKKKAAKARKADEIDTPIPPPPPPPKASKKQVAAYNAWAKKINDKNNAAEANNTNDYAIIKLKEVKAYKAIYNSMTDEQRKKAQPFPDAPPPPPPHPGYNKKEKGGPNANNQSGERNRDLNIREIILLASKKQTKQLLYKIDNEISDLNTVEAYIKKHQDADIFFIEGETNILKFSKSKSEKMSLAELQKVYTKVFKNYQKTNGTKILHSKVKH